MQYVQNNRILFIVVCKSVQNKENKGDDKEINKIPV